MVVEEIEANQVLDLSRKALGIPGAVDVHDPAFLAGLVRRAAGILCPCSQRTLRKAVLESLNLMTEDTEQLASNVENAIEKATIAGDLLELSQVTTEDSSAKSTWVFAAPPAFVVHPSGTVFIMGVAPDEASPLPPSLSARIEYRGHYRVIHPHHSENLPEVLCQLGMLELSEQTWLKLPKQEQAKEFCDHLERQLLAQAPSGDVLELQILDSARDVTYYKGRWVSPKSETGCFIARRPQAYGADLWGFARLTNGVLDKFLDFPPPRDRWRGSDFAWHLQMAIDSCRGRPQTYRRRAATGGKFLDFFSPLPLWAERRLAIIGRPAERERCLFTYFIPEPQLPAEEEFLQQRLWLMPSDSQKRS